LVLSAGYLGSMLWGALIIVLSSKTKRQRWLTMAIAAFVLLMTLLYVRSLFGFAFAMVAAAALGFMGLKLSNRVNAFVLQVIGMTSCLYAVLDVVDDVLQRPGIGSDADMLASHTLIPSMVWGVLWIAISVVVTAVALLVAAQKPAASPATALLAQR
jgi:hypothetical protein